MGTAEMATLTHDNRGDESFGYGFVYFSDGRRVAWTADVGVHSGVTGGWEPVPTAAQEKAADEYLKVKGLLR